MTLKQLGILYVCLAASLGCAARAGELLTVPGRSLVAEPAQPLPAAPVLNPKRLALGQKLFHEPRLSSDGVMTCATCHDLAKGGADGRRFSPTIGGGFRTRNTPTIFNAALLPAFNWDGNVVGLRQEVGTVIESKTALNIQWNSALKMLRSDASYAAAFREAYGRRADRDNVIDALATFIESLVTTLSRFDRFLHGDYAALTDEEKDGYRLFKAYGCSSCHQGRLLGGTLFAPFGIFGNYVKDRGNVTDADNGRYNLTKNTDDKFVFRVPSLRDVALTAPYFHDGGAKDLDEAVELMGKYMLGRELTKNDITAIVRFLKTLTGRLDDQRT